jgi:cytochrome c oxidase subunit 1
MHFLGVAGMPRRIPDYPDAFYTFNKISSWGAEISAFSLLIFLGLLIEAFYNQKKVILNKKIFMQTNSRTYSFYKNHSLN